MKLLIALALSISFSATAKDSKQLFGENANPTFANCLKEDQCPSQQCPNSCAMINRQQQSGERSRSAKVPGRTGGKGQGSLQ